MDKIVEKALLVGLNITTNVKKVDDIDINDYMEELKELAKAAGAEVVGSIIQNRPAREAAFYIGKGRVGSCLVSSDLNISFLPFFVL